MHSDSSAFLVRHARQEGLSRRAADSADLERPFHGLRCLPCVDDGDDEHRHPLDGARLAVRRNALHFAAHMHIGEFFSHTTAAVLWGLPLPWVDPERVDVSVLAPGRAPRGRGVRGRQLAPAQVAVTRHPDLGVSITTPAATWAQLGGVVPHLYDLTALADAIVRVPRMPGPYGGVRGSGLASIADLRAELERGRRVGIRTLEEALACARQGSSSRPETWTRLTLVHGGLPEPVLDHDVYDERGGFVGCVDLAYPALRIAVEYEGDQHRIDLRQWNRDIEKYDRLEELGWRVIRVTRTALFERPGDLVGRVRSAVRSRG